MSVVMDPRLRRAYRPAPLAVRAHTAARWAAAPLTEVETYLPERGRILEFGCGHGVFSLLAALASEGRSITGVDIDERKIVEAGSAASHLGLDRRRADFKQIDGSWTPGPDDCWQAIAVLDVLYLLGREKAAEWMDAAVQSLSPTGTLIVKEVDPNPRMGRAVIEMYERGAKWLDMTRGRTIDLLSPIEIAAMMSKAGLKVDVVSLEGAPLVTHALVIGRQTEGLAR